MTASGCEPCVGSRSKVDTSSTLRDAGSRSAAVTAVPLHSDLVVWLEHRLHLQCTAIQAQHEEIVAELVRRCEAPVWDEASLDAAAAAFANGKQQEAVIPSKQGQAALEGTADREPDARDRSKSSAVPPTDHLHSNHTSPAKQVSWRQSHQEVAVTPTIQTQQTWNGKALAIDEQRSRRSTRVDIESIRGTVLAIVDEDKQKPVQEPPVSRCQQRFQAWVHSLHFEVITNSIILANALLLAIETQYHGVNDGADLMPEKYHETWDGFEVIIEHLNTSFTIWFVIELSMRLIAGRSQAFRQFWIWFDSLIVVFGLLELLENNPAIVFEPSILRLVRLARMMRVFRLVEMIRAFDSLYLLVRSIQASIGALIWSFVFLVALQVAGGLCISQLLKPYWSNEDNDFESRLLIFKYFGTFGRMMVTMFEITIGNWVPSCRALMDNVTDWFALFYILYTCCFCFAIVRVITAVFITETQRVVSNDDKIAMRKKEKEKEAYLSRLRHMSAELDASGDGRVSYEEFADFIHRDEMKMWLATLEINAHELDNLFKLLDNGEGEIEVEAFINGVSRLKGPATSIDVVTILKTVNTINARVNQLGAHFDKQFPHSGSLQSLGASQTLS